MALVVLIFSEGFGIKEEDSSIFLLLSFALFKLLVLLAEKMACKCPKIVKMSPEGIKTFSELLIRMIFTSDAGDKKFVKCAHTIYNRLPGYLVSFFVVSFFHKGCANMGLHVL